GGILFAMLFLREYIDTIVLSAVVATLFLGGWDTSFLGITADRSIPDLFGFVPPYVMLFVKSVFVFFFIMWFRATLPRLRIDQVLEFCWKFLLPVALVNVFLTAVWILLFGGVSLIVVWLFMLLNVVAAILMLVFWQRRFIGRKWALQPML